MGTPKIALHFQATIIGILGRRFHGNWLLGLITTSIDKQGKYTAAALSTVTLRKADLPDVRVNFRRCQIY